MDREIPIVISDSSDSDDCRIDETRSAPKPTTPFSHPSQDRQTRHSIAWNQSYGAYHPAVKVSSPPKRQASTPSVYIARPNPSTSKSPAVQKDYSDRQVTVRETRRCTFCILDDRGCDGARPCSYCFDPGFACVYPGEEPVAPSENPVVEQVERKKASETKLAAEMTGQVDRAHQNSDNELHLPRNLSSTVFRARNRTESVGRAPQSVPEPVSKGNRSSSFDDIEMHDDGDGSTRSVQHETESDSDEPDQPNNRSDSESGMRSSDDDSDLSFRTREAKALEMERITTTSWLPSSFEEVWKLIETHQANIASHREYIVEAQLASAKLKSKQNVHVDTEKRGVNPFRKMIAAESADDDTSWTTDTLNMKVKARRADYTTLKASVKVLGEDKAAHIPEYKSIGRLRSTFLARNVHGLKFVPYHPGIEEKDLDQRRKDLETRFKDHSSEEFRRQRECLELVYQWSDDFDEILKELQLSEQQIWKWLSKNSLTKCQTCETSCGDPPISTLSGVDISKEEKQRCFWLYNAFMKVAQLGIWHFVSPKPGHVEKQPDVLQKGDSFKSKKEQILCSLCFTHNCLTHGSFVDKEIIVGEAVINDAEEQNNERQKTTLKVGDRMPPAHVCGLYCLGIALLTPQNYKIILGLDSEGLSFSGLRNERIKMLTDLGPFRGTRKCSQVHCFLDKDDRGDAYSHFEGRDSSTPKTLRSIVLSMSRLYSSHARLPCMIAKVARIRCMNAFFLLIEELDKEHRLTEKERTAHANEGQETRKMSAKAAGYHTGKSSLLENRKTWVPCSHKGPCLSSHSDCACAREQVHCEKSCGCADNCRRRFKGCRCKKTCFLDDRCECYAANRECDPQLCHDCGVEEVLDPSNKYRDDMRQGRCRNNRLQLDLPPRTVKGMSEVQGWGLFLGEDLPANSFVGEYKGENISASESDRRGAIYAYVSQEYLFNLNRDNQLDGSRFGNKTRFINNSKAKEFINVFPKVMFVNGVTRIGLFTNRAIKAGEELLYDYGYPAELVKGEFWEKHERAIEHNGVVTPIAKPKFRPRMAKNAVDTPGQEDDEPSPVMRKARHVPEKKKRKRLAEEDMPDLGKRSTDAEEDGEGHMLATGATDSSEYEESSPEDGTSSHVSGSDEVDESEDELSIPTRRVPAARVDRRRGGEAQRRAAQTRMLNRQRAR